MARMQGAAQMQVQTHQSFHQGGEKILTLKGRFLWVRSQIIKVQKSFCKTWLLPQLWRSWTSKSGTFTAWGKSAQLCVDVRGRKEMGQHLPCQQLWDWDCLSSRTKKKEIKVSLDAQPTARSSHRSLARCCWHGSAWDSVKAQPAVHVHTDCGTPSGTTLQRKAVHGATGIQVTPLLTILTAKELEKLPISAPITEIQGNKLMAETPFWALEWGDRITQPDVDSSQSIRGKKSHIFNLKPTLHTLELDFSFNLDEAYLGSQIIYLYVYHLISNLKLPERNYCLHPKCRLSALN